MRPSRRNFAIVLMASVVLGTACARPDAPGVAIAKLQSEIVFGVKEKAALPQPATVPNVTNEPVQPQLARANVVIGRQETTTLQLPPEEDLFVRPTLEQPTKPRPALRAANACPDAALNAFPEEPVPLNVPMDRLPREGLYRWKKSGTSPPTKGLESLGPQTVSGFEQRIIRKVEVLQTDAEISVGGNIVQPAGKTFQYESVLPDLTTGGLLAVTYQVKTNGRSTFVDDPVEEAGGFRTAGEPERGVVLKKIEPLDGSKGGSFQPKTGLLLLPLRVRPGERFSSAAVDSITGQTMQIDGRVIGPVRVDACGEVLEGWQVESVLRTNNANPIKYTYVIATQFGGTFISQTFEKGEGAQKTTLAFSIGQKLPGVVAPQQEG